MKHGIISTLIFAAILLSGCATVGYKTEPEQRTQGVYHEVRKGDTLWKISKNYGVGLQEIVKINRLPNANKIVEGQMIFIPGVSEKLEAKKITVKNHGESFVWPVKGTVVSHFGEGKDLVKNKGIDIETKYGSDIVASRSGKVVFASEKVKGYGKTIIIDHGGGFQTVYAHNSANLARVGSDVKQKEVIAKAGTSGIADRAILHFEIRKDNIACNPFHYLP